MLINTTKKEKTKVNKDLTGIPKSAQDTIPYRRVYTNGIIEIEEGVYTKSYEIEDIEFDSASQEEQEDIFLAFSDFLNAITPGDCLQISYINKNIDKEKFEDKIMMEEKADGLEWARDEYNSMLKYQMQQGRNGLELKKLYTLITHAEDSDEATDKFKKLDPDLSDQIRKITERKTNAMTLEERLGILYDIFHMDDPESHYSDEDLVDGKTVRRFNFEERLAKGKNSKDLICPNSFYFPKNNMKYFRMGDKYCCSLFLSQTPSTLSTKFISEITSLSFNMITSVYLEPIAKDEALKLVKDYSYTVRNKLGDAQKRAGKDMIDPDLVSPELTDANQYTKILRERLVKEKQNIIFTTVTVTIFADSLKELDHEVETFVSRAKEFMCEFEVAVGAQEQCFVSSLPLGNCKVYSDHLFLTETASLFMPYNTLECKDGGGLYYGLNQLSKSMILLNRLNAMNYNGLIFGVSGSGKSFATKRDITGVYLSTDDDIIVIDPSNEYSVIAQEFGGEVIRIAPGSGVYLNPFDLDLDYADEDNPLTLKTDYILSLVETMAQKPLGLTPIEKSITMRCVKRIYSDYMDYLNDTGLKSDRNKVPVLADLYEELMAQPEPEAINLALEIESFAIGQLDSFQHRTNVDRNNRLTVYNIKDIGTGLKEFGLQVTVNDAWNRVLDNARKGIKTRLYIDEIHILVQSENCAKLLQNIWKVGRKFGSIPTGITQDIEDLVNTSEGRGIFNNSDFILMLKQSKIGRDAVAKLLDLSKKQQNYLKNSPKGSGLIYNGTNIIPFEDNFPRNTKLYEVMSTDPNEEKKKIS